MSCDKKKKKTVRFTKDTKDPPYAERCSSCGHRNIIPKIREMDLCMECFKQICEYCLNSMGICPQCESELLETEVIKSSPDNGDTKHPNKEEPEKEPDDEEYSEFSESEDEGEDFMMGQMTGFF